MAAAATFTPLVLAFSVAGLVLCMGLADRMTKRINEALGPNNQREIFLGTLATTLVTMLVMLFIDSHIQNQIAPLGTLSFEFAYSKEAAERMMESWSHSEKLWVALSVGADLLFLGLYSTCIAFGCLMVGRGSDVSEKIASLQFLAAAFDFAENTCLFLILVNSYEEEELDPRLPFAATVCASAKFLLVAIGVGYFFFLLMILSLVPNAHTHFKTS